MDYTNTNDNKPIRHTTFKASKQKENKVSKPIIRNLKIIEPDEELLKTLYIKNPGDKLYEENKHLLDENYQIISGEVEVNGVTFPLYIVISKDERVFLDEIFKSTEFESDKEKMDFIKKSFNVLFELNIIKNLEMLSKLDHSVLKTIKDQMQPFIAFKSSYKFDYYGVSGEYGGYTKWTGTVKGEVNFYNYGKYPIIHEFGHLFDYAKQITFDDNPVWKRLAKKYSSALKGTTRCGTQLSGYTKEDYEDMSYEFFADLFDAYYSGDRTKEGPYLIEFMDDEALKVLEININETKREEKYDELLEDYCNYISSFERINLFYKEHNDSEMDELLSSFIQELDEKILNIKGNIIQSDSYFNEILYLKILPLLKKIKEIEKMGEESYSNENRDNIKKIVSALLDQIRTKDKMNYNDNSLKVLLDDSILQKETQKKEKEMLVEKNRIKSEKNLNTAKKMIDEIHKVLETIERLNLSKSITNELKNDLESIEKMVEVFSSGGFTTYELRVVLDYMKQLNNKIDNINKLPFMLDRMKKRLKDYRKKLDSFVNNNPFSEINIKFKDLVDRIIEFLNNNPFTDEEYENSNIRYYIKDLYERLTDLLDYSSIRDITEDDYERIETSFHSVLNNIEIEGYERHINI